MTYTYIHTYIHTYMSICVYVYICMYILSYICIYIYMVCKDRLLNFVIGSVLHRQELSWINLHIVLVYAHICISVYIYIWCLRSDRWVLSFDGWVHNYTYMCICVYIYAVYAAHARAIIHSKDIYIHVYIYISMCVLCMRPRQELAAACCCRTA